MGYVTKINAGGISKNHTIVLARSVYAREVYDISIVPELEIMTVIHPSTTKIHHVYSKFAVH